MGLVFARDKVLSSSADSVCRVHLSLLASLSNRMPVNAKRATGTTLLPLMSGAYDFDMELGSVDHAEDRTGLKTLWTLKPALVVHDDGSVWQTHRIIKPKGEPFTVHMAVKPGVNPKDDMKVDSMQLWAGAPRPAGVKSVVMGAIGGEFRDASGDTAARLLSLKVGAGGKVTVSYLKFKVGGAEPAMSQAKDIGWAAFWDKYKSKVQEDAAPVEGEVPLAEYEQLRSVLLQAEMVADTGAGVIGAQASVALQDLGQLVSTLFKAEIVERSDILTAVGSLEAQLGAHAAAKGREGWFSMAKIGMMRGVSAEQLAQSLLAVWFGGTPPTRRAPKAKRGREAPVVSVAPSAPEESDSEDSDDSDDAEGPKHHPRYAAPSDGELTGDERDDPPPAKKRVTICPTQLLQSLAPKLDLVVVAETLFGDKVLCEAADVELFPTGEDGAVSPERLAMRYARALQRLIDMVGKEWMPSKPKSTLGALGLLVEDVRDLVARSKRRPQAQSAGGAQAQAVQGAADASGGDSNGKAAAPLSRESADRAVPSVVAARLHHNVARLQEVWTRSGCDVGVTVAAVDSSMRSDLQRVLSSNGKVDAAG